MARVLVNEDILADEVLLQDEGGDALGLHSRGDALALARARNCDLVQEQVFSSPPRCRLVPSGRGAALAARTARVAAGGAPKEIRISTAMGQHDVDTRRRQATELLRKGFTVKLSARLARSERANPAVARALLERLAREMESVGRAERKPYGESGALALLLEPRGDG